MDASHSRLEEKFDKLSKNNDTQHGEATKEISDLKADIREIAAGLKQALDVANEKLASKSKIIRGLEIALVFLLAMIVESKAHLVELLKAIAGG